MDCKYKVATAADELRMDVMQREEDSLHQDLLDAKKHKELLRRRLARQKLMLATWRDNKREGDLALNKLGTYDKFMDTFEDARFRRHSPEIRVQWLNSLKVEPCVGIIFDFLPLSETFYLRRNKQTLVHTIICNELFTDYISCMVIVHKQWEDCNHFLDNYEAYIVALQSHIHETNEALDAACQRREFYKSAGLALPDLNQNSSKVEPCELPELEENTKTDSGLEMEVALRLSLEDDSKHRGMKRTRSEAELELAIAMSLQDVDAELDLFAPPLKKQHKSAEQVETLRNSTHDSNVSADIIINPIHVQVLCQRSKASEAKVIEALRRNRGDQIQALLDLKLGFADPEKLTGRRISIQFFNRPIGFSMIAGSDYKNTFIHTILDQILHKKGLKLKSQIISVNGLQTAGRPHSEIVQIINTAKLPVTIEFTDDKISSPQFPTKAVASRTNVFSGFNSFKDFPDMVKVLRTFTTCEAPRAKLLGGIVLKVVLRRDTYVVIDNPTITTRLYAPDLKHIGPCTEKEQEKLEADERRQFQEATSLRIFDPEDHRQRLKRTGSAASLEVRDSKRRRREPNSSSAEEGCEAL